MTASPNPSLPEQTVQCKSEAFSGLTRSGSASGFQSPTGPESCRSPDWVQRKAKPGSPSKPSSPCVSWHPARHSNKYLKYNMIRWLIGALNYVLSFNRQEVCLCLCVNVRPWLLCVSLCGNVLVRISVLFRGYYCEIMTCWNFLWDITFKPHLKMMLLCLCSFIVALYKTSEAKGSTSNYFWHNILYVLVSLWE